MMSISFDKFPPFICVGVRGRHRHIYLLLYTYISSIDVCLYHDYVHKRVKTIINVNINGNTSPPYNAYKSTIGAHT